MTYLSLAEDGSIQVSSSLQYLLTPSWTEEALNTPLELETASVLDPVRRY